MEYGLEILVGQASEGSQEALETLVARIQDQVFALALRMLGHPADAEDAAQEILIKVITHLTDFRGESAFSTWVYRIGVNHLLTTRRRRAELQEIGFDIWEEAIAQIGNEPWPETSSTPEQELLVEETRLSCLQGMLLCLEREVRAAYILGEIMETTSEEGALILGITPAAYRKRLSRGRARIREFMSKNCDLVNPGNPCSCSRQACSALRQGHLDPKDLSFVGRAAAAGSKTDLRHLLKSMDELGRVAALFRTVPEYKAPESFAGLVKQVLESERYRGFAQ